MYSSLSRPPPTSSLKKRPEFVSEDIQVNTCMVNYLVNIEPFMKYELIMMLICLMFVQMAMERSLALDFKIKDIRNCSVCFILLATI